MSAHSRKIISELDTLLEFFPDTPENRAIRSKLSKARERIESAAEDMRKLQQDLDDLRSNLPPTFGELP